MQTSQGRTPQAALIPVEGDLRGHNVASRTSILSSNFKYRRLHYLTDVGFCCKNSA